MKLIISYYHFYETKHQIQVLPTHIKDDMETINEGDYEDGLRIDDILDYLNFSPDVNETLRIRLNRALVEAVQLQRNFVMYIENSKDKLLIKIQKPAFSDDLSADIKSWLELDNVHLALEEMANEQAAR